MLSTAQHWEVMASSSDIFSSAYLTHWNYWVRLISHWMKNSGMPRGGIPRKLCVHTGTDRIWKEYLERAFATRLALYQTIPSVAVRYRVMRVRLSPAPDIQYLIRRWTTHPPKRARWTFWLSFSLLGLSLMVSCELLKGVISKLCYLV